MYSLFAHTQAQTDFCKHVTHLELPWLYCATTNLTLHFFVVDPLHSPTSVLLVVHSWNSFVEGVYMYSLLYCDVCHVVELPLKRSTHIKQAHGR